ncbi:MAG: hypothetical protein WCG65_09710 [Actinomycetes bacterium]
MKRTFRCIIASSALLIAGLCAVGQNASANPLGSCNMGALVTSGLGLAIDGVAQTAGARNSFGNYTLVVCRDLNNSSYTTSLGGISSPYSSAPDDLTQTDTTHVFTITFSPQAGDIPLLAEGHGNITKFAYDAVANVVTVIATPMFYSDIWGNDCNNQGPLACAAAVTKATHDSVALWYSVRFQDSSGKGSEWGYLPNMIWSSNAYMFWDRTSCPGQANADLSYSGIQFEIGGPHFRSDGVTPNTAQATVFMPTDTVIKCWGAPPSVVAANLQITRTEYGLTQVATTDVVTEPGLQYSVTATEEGMLITIPQVTFSVPKYTMGTKSKKSLSHTTKTIAQVLTLAHIVKPSKGSIKVTITSVKTCVAALGKLYGFKSGTCSFMVTSYSKAGKKVKAAKGTFHVQ